MWRVVASMAMDPRPTSSTYDDMGGTRGGIQSEAYPPLLNPVQPPADVGTANCKLQIEHI